MDLDKKIILKDGKRLTVRPARITDAEDLSILFNKVFEQNHKYFTMSHEEALDRVKTIEDHVKWLENAIDKQWLALFAFDNDKIVARCTVSLCEKKRQSHIGVISMVILEEYTSNGLGSVLMAMMIDWAQADSMLEKLALCVISNNQRACNMYKKFGFIEEGRRVNEFKHGPDEYYDEICMYMMV